MREVERRASEYGLQPVRWPDPWPANTLHAMRVATYAKSIGRTVSFALAAFRQAFAGGRDLTDPDNVAIAAAACELHPNAVAKAAASASVKARLRDATQRAGDRGVFGVPTVVVGDEVFWGDDRLEEAVAAAGALAAGSALEGGASPRPHRGRGGLDDRGAGCEFHRKAGPSSAATRSGTASAGPRRRRRSTSSRRTAAGDRRTQVEGARASAVAAELVGVGRPAETSHHHQVTSAMLGRPPETRGEESIVGSTRS